MAIFLISYDLKNYAPSHDYKEVHQKIYSFGIAIRILESTFLVDTVLTSTYMSEQIIKVYQPESHFVVELKPGVEGAGRLDPAYWTWIKARLETR